MAGEIAGMYRDDMEHRLAKPDIGEVGVFCRVCHRWNDGESDLCSHCGERLVGARPLRSGSITSWVEGQVDERNALGIPVSGGDRDQLHEWVIFEPASRIAEPDADDTGRLVARTQELMSEFGLSKRKAWLTARLELGISANPPNFLGYERIGDRPALSRPSVAARLKRLINPPPFMGYDQTGVRPALSQQAEAARFKRWKWIRLSVIGTILVFAAGFVLLVVVVLAELLFDPTSDTGAALVEMTRWIFLAVSLLGIALVPVGVIGWLVVAAENWGDFFSSVTWIGTMLTIGFFVLAGIVAFSGQDGTDLESKENMFFFLLLRGVPIGVLVALIGSLGSAGVRFHHRRATTASSALDTDRQN